MRHASLAALVLALPAAGCAVPPGGNGDATGDVGADDDDSTPEEDLNVCHGDALVDNVPISDDLDALEERFDVNEDLVRIMFLGEPF